ncbi:LYR motif-containing protein 4 isoform X1 [Lagopus muta]|uniref:LYR motif-containing protein 4 isoform X1 n=1 Tax=Lagopus muta TaxID=64668 RepID=UPI00209E95D5|nr:LYR motif-containing protein 4 isoform X1 [Lagopus muta]
MAASSRVQVLRLYRALLRESQRFSGYNYRTYAIRRIRDAFRENKSIKDSAKIEELVNKAKENLEIIHRQIIPLCQPAEVTNAPILPNLYKTIKSEEIL